MLILQRTLTHLDLSDCRRTTIFETPPVGFRRRKKNGRADGPEKGLRGLRNSDAKLEFPLSPPNKKESMPPHGPGMIGGGHSHDPEYPDDDWNLYSMLDTNETRFLNITQPTSGIRVFKPFIRRFEAEPHIISDADAEIIVTAVFTSPCTIRKFMIMGGGEPDNHPAHVKLYVNNNTLDFQNIAEVTPVQEFDLQVNLNGSVEVLTAMHRFSNISSLTMYFTGNHGDLDATIIQYIGLQGDHTHYRREPVHTMYEVLCNGQDIPQMEDAAGSHSHLH